MKKFPFEKLPHWLQSILRPDVIKAMQIKFVAMAMTILILVFMIMLTAINMIMKTVSQSQSMELLIKIAESDRYNSLNDDRPMEDIPPPEEMMPPEFMTETETDSTTETESVAVAELQVENITPLGWIPPDEEWKRDDRGRRDGRIPEFEDDTGNEDDAAPDDDFDDDDRPPQEWPDVPPWERWETEQWNTEYTQPPNDTQPPQTPETQPPEPPAPVMTDVPVVAEPVQPEERPPEEVPPSPEENPVPESEIILSESETQATEISETQASEMTESESAAQTVPESKELKPDRKPDEENPSNNQQPPEGFRMEMRPNKWKVNISLDHFALMADSNGTFLGIRNTENYTEEQAEEILSAILSTGKQQGMYGWLQYYKAQKEYGTLLVVTDKSSDQGLLNNLFRTTIIAGVIVLLILFIFLIFFSRWIIRPVRTAMERQKQFVSDASHELKTPIAVLTANVDILQDEIGENKWLGYIQEQTGRMNQLVGDLLRLARMDNATQEYSFKEFNLSTAIEATALPFESQAFEKQKNLEIDIQPNVMYTGSEQHIRQLAAIFIDNAMKYSNEHGVIKITLLQRGETPVLEFYNTGCEISQEETDKIFERFYRGDKARNNKGKNGYGLGLAIAKSIMEIHKIKIQVTCEQGAWIRFLMTL